MLWSALTLGAHSFSVRPPATNKPGNTALGAHASSVPSPMTNKPGNTALGAHASSGLPSMTNKPGNTALGAHASSVLASMTNKPAEANKTRNSSVPVSSLPHDPAYNRSAGTAVIPLLISGHSPDFGPLPAPSLAGSSTFNRDDLSAVSRLHNSRRKMVHFKPGARAVLALLCSANPRPLSNHGNKGGDSRTDLQLQFEPGHSTDPNRTRPQFSTEKSGNNSAISAKPTNKGNGVVSYTAPLYRKNVLTVRSGTTPNCAGFLWLDPREQ
jgi:hypothetical protein